VAMDTDPQLTGHRQTVVGTLSGGSVDQRGARGQSLTGTTHRLAFVERKCLSVLKIYCKP
jgi:hypothetical protein